MDFLKKHSTSSNLLESLNDWTISLSNHRTVVVAYIDFQKAFDSVSHPKLLHKLSSYRINGNLYYWISAFLSDRRQQVKVGSSSSTPCNVISGVPQGSVIGSLLFNLFINDVTDHLDSTSTTKIFADDIKIYTELINHNSFLKYQIDLIESVQRTFTKRLPGFANLTYAERLLNLQLQSLQQRRLLFDLKMCYNIVYGVCDLRFSDFLPI